MAIIAYALQLERTFDVAAAGQFHFRPRGERLTCAQLLCSNAATQVERPQLG